MERRLKERLVGAVVLVAIAITLIPIILSDPPETSVVSGSDIREKSEMGFSSRIIPIVEDDAEAASSTIESTKTGSEDSKSGKVQKENKQDVLVEENISENEKISSAKEAVQNDVEVGSSVWWIVQLGSFTDAENAASLKEKLKEAGFQAFVEPFKENGEISYKVRVGPEIKRLEVDLLLKSLKEKTKLDGIIISYP